MVSRSSIRTSAFAVKADFFPDSDFFEGETDSKGHEFEFVLGLHKNVTIGIDYYNTEAIRRRADNGDTLDEEIVQVDLVTKW